jgi:hypothetical protein
MKILFGVDSEAPFPRAQKETERTSLLMAGAKAGTL